jgi:prepilin-type processing-associated H-X9-DG protein
MNSHFRRYGPPSGHAKITDAKKSSDFVLVGDGLSLDSTGMVDSVFESGQFSFEVNDITEASPSLRHRGGANICFVDGHAATINNLKTINKTFRAPLTAVNVKTWESEYVNAAGTPSDVGDPTKTPAAQGLSRNPNMPLIWSDPPRLYRK